MIRIGKASPSTLIALAVSNALFMDLVDSSALGTAVPALAQEFRCSPIALKFALTIYLLMVAVLVPASGWVADRWGARRVFFNAVIVFLVGSVCCALSNSLAELVCARILQGVGGGMMTPVGRLIVLGSTDRSELVRALNWFTIPAIVGPLIGPPLAGFLVEYASWRWIFLINLPVGLAGLVGVLAFVPRLRHPHPGKFDALGAVLAALSIAGVVTLTETVGMALLSRGEWLAVLASTAIVAVWAIRHALSVENPALEFRLLTIQTFRASLIGGFAFRLGLGATPFLLPLMLQVALHWSPVEAGLVMLSGTLGALACRFAMPAILRRWGFRATLLFFGAAASVAGAFPALYQTTMPAFAIFGLTILTNFVRTGHFVASAALAFADIPVALNSRASTLSTVLQQLSLSLGISFAAMLLFFSTRSEGGFSRPQSFILPFVAIGVVGLAALPGYFRLLHGAAGEMSGHVPRTGGAQRASSSEAGLDPDPPATKPASY